MRGRPTGTRSLRESGKEGARATGQAGRARGEWKAEKGRGESDLCELAPALTSYRGGQPLRAPREPQNIGWPRKH